MGILSHFLDRSRQPGVYRIYNWINGKSYIGSTTRSMRLRWEEHRYRLSADIHPNWLLLADWRKYGPWCFSFSVLEVVTDLACMMEREMAWQRRIRNVYTLQFADGSLQYERQKVLSEWPGPVDVARWLAKRKSADTLSANEIYKLVGGNRNEVLQVVREARPQQRGAEYVTPYAGRPTDKKYYPEEPSLEYQPPTT